MAKKKKEMKKRMRRARVIESSSSEAGSASKERVDRKQHQRKGGRESNGTRRLAVQDQDEAYVPPSESSEEEEEDEIVLTSSENDNESGQEGKVVRKFTPRKSRPVEEGGEFEFDPDGGSEKELEEEEEEEEAPRTPKRRLRRRIAGKLKRANDSSSSSSENENGEENDDDFMVHEAVEMRSSELSSSDDEEGDDDDDKEQMTRKYYHEHRVREMRGAMAQKNKVKNTKWANHSCNETDAITMEPLKKKHATWTNAQQTVRYCYNLDTLKKIALSKGTKWLEPPTFLTPMSEGMKDQIREVFGEAALKIEEALQGMLDHWFSSEQQHNFWERIFALQREDLRPGDFYLCPICYELAAEEFIDDRVKIELEGSDTDEEEVRKRIGEQDMDPIAILSHYNDWEGGADVCFRSQLEVKRHLLRVHTVAVSGKDESNLLQSYRLRATDGLVQRFVMSRQRSQKETDLRRVGGAWAKYYWKWWTENAGIYNMIHDLVYDTSRGTATVFPMRRLKKDSADVWKELTASFHDDGNFIADEDEVQNEIAHAQAKERALYRKERKSGKKKKGRRKSTEFNDEMQPMPKLVDDEELAEIRKMQEKFGFQDGGSDEDEVDIAIDLRDHKEDEPVLKKKRRRRGVSDESDDDDGDEENAEDAPSTPKNNLSQSSSVRSKRRKVIQDSDEEEML